MASYREHRLSNGSAFDEGVVVGVRRVVARIEPKDPDVVYGRGRGRARRNGYFNGIVAVSA